jgi:putative membrane protein
VSAITVTKILTSWELGASAEILYLGLVLWAAIYLMAAARPSPRGRRWPRARTAWFLAGLALLAFVYGSGLERFEDDPTVHVIQHMLVMMVVPALLLLGAPITLLLRTITPRRRRAVVDFLGDPSLRLLSGRWAPIVLSVDYYLTMYVYQLTPLRTYSESHAFAHFLVHQYFLICGLAFWLPLAGVDPVRFRPSRRLKLSMIMVGLPANALLGAIVIAQGQTAAGWAYIVCGAAFTIVGAAIVAVRARPGTRRANAPSPEVRARRATAARVATGAEENAAPQAVGTRTA